MSAADHPKLESLVQRVAQLTGRTLPDARAVLTAMDATELDRLAGLGDVDFLKESMRLMKPDGAGPTAPVEQKQATIAPTPPENSKAKKRLVLPNPNSPAPPGPTWR